MKSLRKSALEHLVHRRPIDALWHAAEVLPIQGIRRRLPPASPLYRAGVAEGVDLPFDRIIMPRMLHDEVWQPEQLAFVAAHAPKGPTVLFDLGANVGLVTRQWCHVLPNIVAAVCWEPHPLNHRLLVGNVSHLPQVRCLQVALGTEDGTLPFYLDGDNAGNYSLVPDSMAGAGAPSIPVACRAIGEAVLDEPLTPAERELPVIWKTDVQGLDELLTTSLPDRFWARVAVGVIEITRLPRPNYDRARLAAILEQFPVRRLARQSDRLLSTAEVLAFAEGRDGDYDDLLFARA